MGCPERVPLSRGFQCPPGSSCNVTMGRESRGDLLCVSLVLLFWFDLLCDPTQTQRGDSTAATVTPFCSQPKHLIKFKAVSAPHPWFNGWWRWGKEAQTPEAAVGPSPEPATDTSGSSSPHFSMEEHFISTSLAGVLRTCTAPEAGVKAVNSHHSNTTTPGAAAHTVVEAAPSLP